MKRPCSHKNCPHEGLHPAPQTPDKPRPYRYFCLEHIREYNARWNFLGGLSEQEVERHIRDATVWERPTWPLGKGPLNAKTRKKPAKDNQDALPPNEIIRALVIFELEHPTALTLVKKKHRELVKRYHPDSNDGQNSKINEFYLIQEAFKSLKKYYASKKIGSHT